MPEMRDECYARGYRRGLDDGMRFDAVHLEPEVPAELDGAHALSWTRGYEEGETDGQVFRGVVSSTCRARRAAHFRIALDLWTIPASMDLSCIAASRTRYGLLRSSPALVRCGGFG
jgi:hypothetical protein